MSRPTYEANFSEKEISELLKVFPQGLVAFDLETTGLSPVIDKIIEIAAVKIDSERQITTYHTLINPLIEIPEYTVQYHNITNDLVKDAPSLKKPIKEFANFIGNLPLIAHNAQFDAGFYMRGLHLYNLIPGKNPVYDSCHLARVAYKKETEIKPENYKLSSLAEFFKIDFTHHQAMDDAVVCLKAFARTLEKVGGDTTQFVKSRAYVFNLKNFKKAVEYELPKKFNLLKEHLPDKLPFQMRYAGGTQGNDFRPVRPIAIIPLPQGLVLYGECLISNMNKNFMLKKIKELKK